MTHQLKPLPDCDLPIFWQTTEAYILFYAPGYVVVAAPDEAGELADSIAGSAPPQKWSDTLREFASHAVHLWDRQQTEPFIPECLTLYLHNRCNLGCTYCYTNPSFQPADHIEPEAIRAGAELVAENCRAKGLPFTAVFHGGGEPSLFQDEIEHALKIVEQTAQRQGLTMFRYIATNGVMSEAKAQWLAAHFDLIGLSCDGPPAIQNRQRPNIGGGGTALFLEQTVNVWHRMGQSFHVRATITRETVQHQPAIAEYICQQLTPDEIHFEPIYMGGRTSEDTAFSEHEAREFVSYFLAAQEIAHKYDIPLSCSGSRLSTIHGTYCHVFRQVLNLVPGGVATTCFKLTYANTVLKERAETGVFNPTGGTFHLDVSRINSLRLRLGSLPDTCLSCFNRFHCTRDCPDQCALAPEPDLRLGFRCQVQYTLAYHRLRSTADRLWSDRVAGETVIAGIRLL